MEMKIYLKYTFCDNKADFSDVKFTDKWTTVVQFSRRPPFSEEQFLVSLPLLPDKL